MQKTRRRGIAEPVGFLEPPTREWELCIVSRSDVQDEGKVTKRRGKKVVGSKQSVLTVVGIFTSFTLQLISKGRPERWNPIAVLPSDNPYYRSDAA